MSIEIEESVLKKACMEMIETIFYCLPNAFKGTIYRVGKMPGLNVERITSGIIDENRREISWGLPSDSGYNPPGKAWIEYRDEPGRPLEAMSWCVERQKSWTAEDPTNDSRSVRLQVETGVEDFQHMEPVLVRKSDLSLDMYSSLDYPVTYGGGTIWKDSDYVVVAVIKIHFRPYTIHINSQETRVIKKLSRSLGTELLSYQLRQDSVNAMQDLAKDRLNACNILADSLRNAITKFGLVFSLIKQEIGFLRDQWENALLQERDEKNLKKEGIQILNSILSDVSEVDDSEKEVLKNAHNRFLELSLPPEQGSKWVEMQIGDKWNQLFNRYPLPESKKAVVQKAIMELKTSLKIGQDPEIVSGYDKIPEMLKRQWVELIYENIDAFDMLLLDRLIEILDNTALNIPSRERSRKTLMHLRALAETMSQLERNTNFLLHQVLNGNGLQKGGEDIINQASDKSKNEGLSIAGSSH